MTTYNTPGQLVGGYTDDSGTTTTVLTSDSTDANRRLPAFLALSKALGGVYIENPGGMSVHDALERAGLDFVVAKHKIEALVGGTSVQAPDKLRATIAVWPGSSRPPQMLGVVGKSYEIVQPPQAAAFGQAVLEEGGASVAAVTSYGDPRGSRMCIALKLPEGLLIGGSDPHDVYLTIGNSFDRTTGLWACVAPIRIACTNQAAATFGSLANRFSIRHTGDVTNKVTEVQRALEITGTFSEAYARAAERMLAESMVGREIDEFLETLLPTPKGVKAQGQQNWEARREHVAQVIRRGENNEFGRDTRYAAYQGVTEWADHMSKANSLIGRYMRLVDGGPVEQIKVRAAHLLLSGV